MGNVFNVTSNVNPARPFADQIDSLKNEYMRTVEKMRNLWPEIEAIDTQSRIINGSWISQNRGLFCAMTCFFGLIYLYYKDRADNSTLATLNQARQDKTAEMKSLSTKLESVFNQYQSVIKEREAKKCQAKRKAEWTNMASQAAKGLFAAGVIAVAAHCMMAPTAGVEVSNAFLH